jgi:hypothetical protein
MDHFRAVDSGSGEAPPNVSGIAMRTSTPNHDTRVMRSARLVI